MVGGKLQRRKHHVVHVLALSRVVFDDTFDFEIGVEKQNEVFRVLVAFGVLLLQANGFVQLGL